MDGRKAHYRVLIVEDQHDVRKVLAKQIETAGYAVTACENGEAALEALTRDDFDLVITDIVMPGTVQGPELAMRQCQRKPGQKFIYLSGFSDQFSWAGYAPVAGFPRLAKPVFRADILAAIEKALD